jgi:hypothetical protein
MIESKVKSEFGEYTVKYNHGHKVNHGYVCIDAYEDVSEDEHWMKCPCCNFKPKVWRFNNGLSTACGCGGSMYNHFAVVAESILSVYSRTGCTAEYSRDTLRKNWNEYCQTMISPCSHGDLFIEGKW